MSANRFSPYSRSPGFGSPRRPATPLRDGDPQPSIIDANPACTAHVAVQADLNSIIICQIASSRLTPTYPPPAAVWRAGKLPHSSRVAGDEVRSPVNTHTMLFACSMPKPFPSGKRPLPSRTCFVHTLLCVLHPPFNGRSSSRSAKVLCSKAQTPVCCFACVQLNLHTHNLHLTP